MKFRTLLLIITIGALLRFVKITTTPPSLNWDEISHGYTAYSILHTGKDEWGAVPFGNFRAYGDYPTTAYMYLNIPFIWAFGLNELSVRLPSAVFGTLTLIPVYFLGLRMGKTISNIGARSLGLLSAFLLATSPWHILQSRAAFQSTIAIFTVTSGFALFINRHWHKSFFPLSMLFFILSLFSYHNARIFSPILLFVLFLANYHEFFGRQKIKSTIFWLTSFASILLLIVFSSNVTARSKWVGILDEGAINKINFDRGSSKLKGFPARLIHNKITYLGAQTLLNYLGYFSPRYLFINGGTQYQYSIPGLGLMHLIEMPFFYLGLLSLLSKRKTQREVLLALLIAPIPAAVTQGGAHVIRSSLMLPFVQLASAVGFLWASEIISLKLNSNLKPILLAIFVLACVLSLEKYTLKLFTSYKTDYSWAWQYGYKEVVNFVKNHPEYQTVIVTKKYGEPHEYFLFYLGFNPLKFQNDPNLIRYFQSNWYWVDRFDKYWFLNDWQIKDLITEKGIHVMIKKPAVMFSSPNNFPQGWKKIDRINFLDGSPSFEILIQE